MRRGRVLRALVKGVEGHPPAHTKRGEAVEVPGRGTLIGADPHRPAAGGALQQGLRMLEHRVADLVGDLRFEIAGVILAVRQRS